MKGHPCPCCGYLTLSGEPPGTFEICPVCFWEDDDVQFRDPAYAGGANGISLNQARSSFQVVGAISPDHVTKVRPPDPSEVPG